MSSRRLVGGKQPQGMDETVSYEFDFKRFTEKYGSPTSAAACSLYNLTTKEDASGDCLTGEMSQNGTIIVSKKVTNLLDDREYQLNVSANFTGGLVFSGFLVIRGER